MSDDVTDKKARESGANATGSGQHHATNREAEEEFIRRVGDEVERRMRASGKLGTVEKEAEEAQRDLKLHHRIIYGSLVFFAVVLVWYGLDELIPEIPVLETGVGAVVAGVLLLALCGSLFKSLFGVYLPRD